MDLKDTNSGKVYKTWCVRENLRNYILSCYHMIIILEIPFLKLHSNQNMVLYRAFSFDNKIQVMNKALRSFV